MTTVLTLYMEFQPCHKGFHRLQSALTIQSRLDEGRTWGPGWKKENFRASDHGV